MQNARPAWQDARLQSSHAGTRVLAPALAQQIAGPTRQNSGPAQQIAGPTRQNSGLARQISGPAQQVAGCVELISSSSIGPQGLLSSSWAPEQVTCSALGSFRAPKRVSSGVLSSSWAEQCTEVAVTTMQ